MTASVAEKRGSLRAQVNRPGSIRVGIGPETSTQVIDISQTGASLYYASPLDVGTEVELRFHLNIGAPVKCLAYGEVRHHAARGGSHILGVRFTHFVPETVEVIRQFIELKTVEHAGSGAAGPDSRKPYNR